MVLYSKRLLSVKLGMALCTIWTPLSHSLIKPLLKCLTHKIVSASIPISSMSVTLLATFKRTEYLALFLLQRMRPSISFLQELWSVYSETVTRKTCDSLFTFTSAILPSIAPPCLREATSKHSPLVPTTGWSSQPRVNPSV